MLKNVNLVDLIQVPTQRTITDAGQMIVPCAFARTGSMNYLASQLGLVDRPADEVVAVMRDEADVFDTAAMESFRSAPVTIGHPVCDEGKPINVTAENAAELQVGMLEGMPVRDEDLVSGSLVIARKDAIDLIEEGTVELSAGYTCDIEVVDSVVYQRNIRANHIAIVAKGRAGSNCRIADEDLPAALEAAEAAAAQVLADQAIEDEAKANQLIADKAAAEIILADELAESAKIISTLTDEKAELVDALEAVKLELTDAVEKRVSVLLVAKTLCNLDEELTGKSVHEIKRTIVLDQLPTLDLEGKGESYVEAMYDIVTDAADAETPMSALLRSHVVADAKVEPKTDPVAEARQRMIERNKK